MTIINESGLYVLIFSSKLPAAQKFQHWVTSEVLPSIRKTGMYISSPRYGINDFPPELQMFKKIFDSVAQTQLEQKWQAKALGYARPNNAVSAHCRYTAKRRIPRP